MAKEKKDEYTVNPKFNDCQISDSHGLVVLADASQRELKRLYESGHAD